VRKVRSLLVGVIIAAGVAGLSLVTAAPAQAAPSNCPSGSSCHWGDANYTTTGNGGKGGGDRVGFKQYIDNFSGYYSWSGSGYYNSANDSASSIYNNGNSCSSGYYRDAGYGSLALRTSKKTGWANLAASGGHNDSLSSGQFICG
jgi:hypothetical protein